MHRILAHRQILLVISTGIVYTWFGMLKFYPGISPAEDLAQATLDKLTFGLVPSYISYTALAAWEVLIGVAMILNRPRTWIIYLALVHLVFTFSPMVLFPDLCFQKGSIALTLVGQYIVKNVMLLSALLFLLPATKPGSH
jgi:uncharacterized membrane protein YkgB